MGLVPKSIRWAPGDTCVQMKKNKYFNKMRTGAIKMEGVNLFKNVKLCFGKCFIQPSLLNFLFVYWAWTTLSDLWHMCVGFKLYLHL